MIAITPLFLSIFLASAVAATGDIPSYQELGESQHDKPTGLLRGGRFSNGKKTIIPPNLDSAVHKMKKIRNLSFDGKSAEGNDNQTADIDEIKHIMIGCMEGEDEFSCKERIMNTIPNDEKYRFRLNNYLQLVNAYPAEVKGDLSIVDGLYGVAEDPKRESMYIKDSIRVHRSLQSNGQSIPYGIDMVKAREVWEKYNTKGENVRICVVDTGVNRDHPDFDANKILGYNGNDLVQPWWHDQSGHGTHVSGTIAASDNDEGVVGVSPGAEVFTARVFVTNDEFFTSGIIAALQACKDGGAQVISMSLGGASSVTFEQQAYEDLFTKFGIITVASSGNSGSTDYNYPAAYDKVISVGSVTSLGQKSSFSTYNNKLDVVAPGSNVKSTWSNGSYATISGTSMACPHVSGIVALMLSVNPSATPSEIVSALKSTASIGNNQDPLIGYGIVNALAAVDAISNDGNNGSGGSGGSGNCVEVVITLHTDRYASDTTHWLSVGTELIFVSSEFKSFQTYEYKTCLDPTKCAEYYVIDEFGDGIAGEGVAIKYGGEVVYSGGDFGFGGVKYLGNCY